MTKAPVIECRHPLLQTVITRMRAKETEFPEFRRLVMQAATLLFVEATADLEVVPCEVETPLTAARGSALLRPDFVLIPILRAGLGMVEGILYLTPNARIGHVGLQRNAATLEADEYYVKLPDNLADSEVLVIDPMLATGGSACAAIRYVKEHGASHIRMLALIAAPEGIRALQAEHPDVPVYAGAIDEKLNDKGYIVPGLGDAGDRLFGTL